MSKKLTIFTPTYNRAHTISRVYKSILQQEKKLLSLIPQHYYKIFFLST